MMVIQITRQLFLTLFKKNSLLGKRDERTELSDRVSLRIRGYPPCPVSFALPLIK